MTSDRTPSFWLGFCGLLVAALCCAWSSDLVAAWSESPLDRFGWLAMLLWAAPIMHLAAHRDSRLRLDARRAPLLVAALACGSVGALASYNILQHVGLVLAATAWVGTSWPALAWAASAVAWLPAFGWLVSLAGLAQGVLMLRVLVGGAGALALLRCRGSEPSRAALGIPRWLGVSAVLAILAASVCWQFVPLQGAEQRLIGLATEGPGFGSRGVALSASETSTLGAAVAVRRLYWFGDQRVVVSVIDATHNRHAVHDPLYCFTGSGWQADVDRVVEVSGGQARHLTFVKEQRRAELVFWFSDGQRRQPRITAYWWQTTLRRLTMGWSGPEPVLVLLQSYDDAPVDWREILCDDSPLFGV